MKRITIILALLPLVAMAQFQFDGGMMLHTGHLSSPILTEGYQAKGMTFGLGGVIQLHAGKHIRIGGEGYTSTLHLMNNGSYARTGWGGLTVNYKTQIKRWHPYTGMTIGGGKSSTLLIFGGNTTDWKPETDITLHEESFFLIAPYIGCEFALTERIHLTSKIDRIIPFSNIKMPVGLRLYFGFVFVH